MSQVMLLSTCSAVFNLLSFILLLLGYREIRARRIEQHKRIMLAALVSSACFLGFYLANRLTHIETPYPYPDLTKWVYFIILVPHVILAAVMTPFIITLVILAFLDKRNAHRKLAKIVWPVWVYVSITGVMVYLMLRIQPLLREPPSPPAPTIAAAAAAAESTVNPPAAPAVNVDPATK